MTLLPSAWAQDLAPFRTLDNDEGAWIDLYGSDDEIKTSSAEVTQAYATASLTW